MQFYKIESREQLFAALCSAAINIEWATLGFTRNRGGGYTFTRHVRQFAGARVHSISLEDGSGQSFCVEMCWGFKDGKPILSNEHVRFS